MPPEGRPGICEHPHHGSQLNGFVVSEVWLFLQDKQDLFYFIFCNKVSKHYSTNCTSMLGTVLKSMVPECDIMEEEKKRNISFENLHVSTHIFTAGSVLR